jgi:hypothetical protein
MSNTYWRAMNTRNAVRASREPVTSPEGGMVPVEPDPPPAPGTTRVHQCRPPDQPNTVPSGYLGALRWECPDCHQTYEGELVQDAGPFKDWRWHWTAVGSPPRQRFPQL